jgi:mannitol/fructose-specific phosphotransferase system IIA component (Ntr-type)
LLPSLLAPDGVVVWESPVTREEAVRTLLDRVVPAVSSLTAAAALRRLSERDALGSTHVGEGVDLPHARIDAVERPVFAVGLTRGGVEDAEAATSVVWLLLLPPGGAGLRTTAQIARACRDDAFRSALRRAEDDRDVRDALARWERAHEAPPGTWTR